MQDLKLLIAEAIMQERERFKNESSTEVKERYLTRSEVAKNLGVSKPTLCRWMNKGILIPKKIGRRILYAESEINKVLNNYERK